VLVAVGSFGGQRLFGLLIILVIVAGVFEYHRLVFGKAFSPEKVQGTLLAVLIPIVFYAGGAQHVLAILTLGILAVFLLGLPRISGDHPDSLPVMKVIFGCCYLPLTLSHFIWLRGGRGIFGLFFYRSGFSVMWRLIPRRPGGEKNSCPIQHGKT
jgi:CDP-diglyceride synthetase